MEAQCLIKELIPYVITNQNFEKDRTQGKLEGLPWKAKLIIWKA